MNRNMRISIASFVSVASATAVFAGEPCDFEWSALGELGPNAQVEAIVTFDDGAQPSVYAAGSQLFGSGSSSAAVARWDGEQWEAIDGLVWDDTFPPIVRAMAVFDDGGGPALYVAGKFDTAAGQLANNIARWDGHKWTTLGTGQNAGTSSWIQTLVVHDDGSGPALYAGGSFETAGGIQVNRIARWDGLSWSPLMSSNGSVGVMGSIDSLATHQIENGATLVVGGTFASAAGIETNGIAEWDGTDWSALPGPNGVGVVSCPGNFCNPQVSAIVSFDDGNGPAIYAGGTFDSMAGEDDIKFIAKWDGSGWSALNGPGGASLNSWVHALEVFDDGSGPALFAGGQMTVADGQTVNRLAKWDGTAWSSLYGPSATGTDETIHSLAVIQDAKSQALLAGGGFTSAGGLPARGIARWSCQPAECFGDVNDDDFIDLADLNLVLANFGQQTSSGDTNGDGSVDLADLNTVLAAFGTDCV